MKWTSVKPTEPGFYWLRSLLEPPQPVQIALGFQEQLIVGFILDDSTYSVNGLHDGYEFFGPVEVPK